MLTVVFICAAKVLVRFYHEEVRPVVTEGNAASHGISSHPEHAIDLDAALANLSSVSRAVVWLHDVEGFTHKEIAGFMGKSESFSKSQLSRAYQRLRPFLEEETKEASASRVLDGPALGSC